MKKQTNPESGTFFKTTGLDCPKCQYHGKKKKKGKENVLDKSGLKRHENQVQHMILYWILEPVGKQLKRHFKDNWKCLNLNHMMI